MTGFRRRMKSSWLSSLRPLRTEVLEISSVTIVDLPFCRRFFNFLPVFVRPSKKSNIATIETHKPRQRIARAWCMHARYAGHRLRNRWCRDIVPDMALLSSPTCGWP